MCENLINFLYLALGIKHRETGHVRQSIPVIALVANVLSAHVQMQMSTSGREHHLFRLIPQQDRVHLIPWTTTTMTLVRITS